MPPDSPPRPPPWVPPAPRPRQASSDDLGALAIADAAEARARDALAQALAAEARTAAAEARARALPAAVPVEAARDDAPTLRVSGHGWRIVAPVGALVAALAAPVSAVVQHVITLERQAVELRMGYAAIQAQIAAAEEARAADARALADLRGTVARLSGYLTQALQATGVSVPGAEPGAELVPFDVELPRSPARAAPQVRIKTRVPAPTVR